MIRRFMAWFFERLYTRWAWAYELVAGVVSLNRWWDWARVAATPLPPGRLLEIGFGTGRLLAEMSRQTSIVGVDQSPEMAAIARQRVLESGGTPLIVRARAAQLPFAGDVFDGAYSSFPSEFAFQEATFRSLARVLRPGSEYSMVVAALLEGRGLLERVMRWLFRVTGQAGPTDVAQWRRSIPAPGFLLTVEKLEIRRSLVVRIRALLPD